jgi:2-dehydro-3-deoxyphosphogluconate aldolase/(4S)-4-hydroxy-2-oxoglutarate aldolase
MSTSDGEEMGTRQATMTAALRRSRLIPVIVIDDPKNAAPLADALLDGGLPIAEVTLRTPKALEALRIIASEKPEMNAGAGTVLNVAQAKQVRDAGGKFCISPGFNRAVVDYCLEHDLPVYPGVATASEIEACLDAGVNLLKLWPIATLGGIPYLQFLAGPFVGVEFNPSGGLDGSTFQDYLKLSNVVACGGPWMTPQNWIAENQFDRIRDAVRESVEKVAKVSGTQSSRLSDTLQVRETALAR